MKKFLKLNIIQCNTIIYNYLIFKFIQTKKKINNLKSKCFSGVNIESLKCGGKKAEKEKKGGEDESKKII